METPNVKNILTREKIDAFPIKNKEMSTQQLRQLCVDFFNFSKTALWICDHDVDFIRNAAGTQDKMTEGQAYGGLPYIGLGTGNPYRTLDYMDEKGVVNISSVIKRKKFNRVYARNLWRNFGNQCANGCYVGWARVISGVNYDGSPAMLQANGFLRVGEYTYPDDLKCLKKEYNSVAICKENGDQTMFKSYAKLQIADGLNNFTTAGHVIMCTVAPEVVYNADGTINGEESYLCITEQAQRWSEQENEFGDKFLMKTSVNNKWTFAKLYEKGYLPFTFAEFHGKEIEDTWCKFSLEGETITDRALFKSHITSNYGIMDAYATVTDEEGKEVYWHAVRCLDANCTDLSFVRSAADPEDHNNVERRGELPTSGTYNVKIDVQLGTGERFCVYEGKLEVEKPQFDLLTWDKINAFPIKNKNMSTRELRQLCADFFRFAKQAPWICDHDVDYIRNSSGTQDKMREGQLYGGLPYIGLATGNVYRMMDYMDENGVVNIASVIGKKKFNQVYKRDLWRNFGNQCANGCYVGWGRVLSSADYSGTPSMQVCRGFLRVGPYKYDDSLDRFKKTYNTVAICGENGEQTMFESYAAMELADGLVNFTTAGHVIMCTVEPVVVRNEDGTINGEESYLCITEQAQHWTEQENDKGFMYLMKPSVDNKHTFAKLFKSGYLPFTFAEFHGKEIEETWCKFSLEGDTITARDLFKAHITSNYGIFDAYATITDDSGKEIYRHAVRCLRSGCKDLAFVRYAAEPDEHNNVEKKGDFPVPGTYNVKIDVQLATGERPTIYEGKLEVENAVVTDPLTWDKINAFPIKYKGMPVQERRQLCADFFRFQKRVNWTPDASHDYTKNPHGAPDRMCEGTVYRGFPYVTVGSGNVYRMMDFIDEKGYIDIKRAATPARKFGNQCAAGVFGGWGRVVNSANYSFTVSMTVLNGFYRVGPYTYDDTQPRFGGDYATTYDICRENGEQVMFESYGAMHLADVLVNYSTAGHIIMCTGEPQVVRNEDGSINGDESFMLITDQAQTWLPGYEENGDSYEYKNNIDWKRTFAQLLKSGYLPMTVPELTGEKDIDDTEVSIDLSVGTVTEAELFAATVKANYGINDVYTIFSKDGKEIYKLASRADINNRRELAVKTEDQFVDTWGTYPGKGVYDLQILVQLYTGERLTVYSGQLTVNS